MAARVHGSYVVNRFHTKLPVHPSLTPGVCTWSSTRSNVAYPALGISRNYLSCTESTNFLQDRRIAAGICNYQLKIGFHNSSQFSRRFIPTFGTSSYFRSSSFSHDSGRQRFFSHSSKTNLPATLKTRKINENTAAEDGDNTHGHFSDKVSHDSPKSKSLIAYNSLNKEAKINGTQLSAKKKASKIERLQKEKAVETNKKIKGQVKEGNQTKDKKIKVGKLKEINGLSDVVEIKIHKTSRTKKAVGSIVSVTSNERGVASYLENMRTKRREMVPLFPPHGKSVMIVESATKAKTIQNYLGDMFDVVPSFGHLRDLARKSGSVLPDDDFSMIWEVGPSASTHFKSIQVALHGAENLILATDPDREGEAIAWHLIEMLHQQDALKENVKVARVVFHEITDASIKSSLQSPREIDMHLVNAYLARRALDYLIGFSVSPLLWRKLPGCQSAGRVQSAALSLVCDREMEIDQFKPQEYWSVEVKFRKTDDSALILSELTYFGSKKLSQFSIGTCKEAESIKKRVSSSNFVVLDSKRSKIGRTPPMPYITSTLQQDSANKLNFTAAHTMKLAQKLYEGVILSDEQATGLITYMRTDGLHISEAAAKDIHAFAMERYGKDYASKDLRKYFKKVKNAQEAHEAIRPTSIWRLPSSLVGILDDESLKLYTLIWTRTIACQMEAAVNDFVQVDIGNPEKDIILRSSSSAINFLGYQAVYKDIEARFIREIDNEQNAANDTLEVLSTLKVMDQLHLKKVECKQHHTKPPGRYSEGSLVKKLEELGIGRPSTYAPILKVLGDRKYITTRSRVLHPEFRGRMVSAFLSHHFSEVFDYNFTADMENELDNVSAGVTDWKGLLKEYWTRFKNYCDLAGNVNIRELENELEKMFGHIVFDNLADKSRTCPSCLVGTLVFKVSRFGNGYFIGCNQHPNCKHIIGSVLGRDDDDNKHGRIDSCFQPKLLGHNPDTNEKIFLKKGPYGYYVQLGDDKKAPRRTSLETKDIESLTVEDAIELLRYPVILGNHPVDAAPVVLSYSKFGFSIRHKRTIAPVPKKDDPKEITLEAALKYLSIKKGNKSGRKPSKKEAVCT